MVNDDEMVLVDLIGGEIMKRDFVDEADKFEDSQSEVNVILQEN